jgi:hypothetical protein
VQFIARLSNAICEAHHQGIRHGAISPDQVVLAPDGEQSLGVPTLHGFVPSRRGWLRREDVATDVAGLAGIAHALLGPAVVVKAGALSRGASSRPSRPSPAVGAVIGAAMDRREGVFLFESPLDFVVALEAALASDTGTTAAAPDPALLSLRGRRRRRRVIRVLAGAAVACLALLVSSATAMRGRPEHAVSAPVLRTSDHGRAARAADSSQH